jgi:Cu/Ag efflux protein CusF
MKKLILLVSLITMVAFVSGAMAQPKPAPAPTPAPAPAPEKPAKMKTSSGTIRMVDEAAKMVDVKKGKKTMSFVIDDQTKITKAGKEISLADLKKGMRVSIEYEKEGDRRIATTIKASSPKAAKKAKPTE